MTNHDPRALVVDDEVEVRTLFALMLTREGFQCDMAADGVEASQMIAENRYDAVVTDLRMPRRHGHALAGDLLALRTRPVIVVLTGITEPKLARDLIARGVDLVVTKPVDPRVFAATVKSLVRRRNGGGDGSGLAEGADNLSRIRAVEIERKIVHLSKILPISQSAFKVFNMTCSNTYKVDEVAAAIASDGSLSVDVLRLANSAVYNSTGARVDDLSEAVVRIGQKRIGELALASTALAAMTANVLPWMDVDLEWRRSIAAGATMNALLREADDGIGEEGLVLSAILHPFGRVVLGALFPKRYQDLADECRRSLRSFQEYEEKLFGLNPGEVVEALLKAWNIPASICCPLGFVDYRYIALGEIPEPARTQVAILKISILLSRIIAGEWEPWDFVELPPIQFLRRIDTEKLSDMLSAVTRETEEMIGAGANPVQLKRSPDEEEAPPSPRLLAYCNLSDEPFDFLRRIVTAMGIRLLPREPDEIAPDENVLLNCGSAQPCLLAARIGPRPGLGERLIVTDAPADRVDSFARFGRVLTLPTGYGALKHACLEMAGFGSPHQQESTFLEAPGV